MEPGPAVALNAGCRRPRNGHPAQAACFGQLPGRGGCDSPADVGVRAGQAGVHPAFDLDPQRPAGPPGSGVGAIGGPLLAISLVALVGVRVAIGLSVIPGLLAALAIIYAIRQTTTTRQRHHQPIRHPDPTGAARAARAADDRRDRVRAGQRRRHLRSCAPPTCSSPAAARTAATQLALVLYVLYDLAATVISIPAGRHGDRFDPVRLAAEPVCFAAGYAVFAAGPGQPCLWHGISLSVMVFSFPSEPKPG